MKPFLTVLWVTGSAVYLASTLLFLNATNFYGRDEAKPVGTASVSVKEPQAEEAKSADPASLPVKEPQAQVAKPAIPAGPQQQAPALAAVERPQAISPDQPAAESPPSLGAAVPLDAGPPLEATASPDAAAPRDPELSPDAEPPLEATASSDATAPRDPELSPDAEPPLEATVSSDAATSPKELPSTAEQPTPETPAEPQVADLPRLKAAANIRSGPSRSAPVIGTATAGAELRVTDSDGGWIQFTDPSSGRSGWVHSRFLEASAGDETTVSAKPADVSRAAPPKSESVKAVKQKANKAVASKRQEPGGPAERYAELPADAEFIPPRKRLRLGILERRRLLRQGLLSPGFVPPQ
jgi:hypothetical protein